MKTRRPPARGLPSHPVTGARALPPRPRPAPPKPARLQLCSLRMLSAWSVWRAVGGRVGRGGLPLPFLGKTALPLAAQLCAGRPTSLPLAFRSSVCVVPSVRLHLAFLIRDESTIVIVHAEAPLRPLLRHTSIFRLSLLSDTRTRDGVRTDWAHAHERMDGGGRHWWSLICRSGDADCLVWFGSLCSGR